jgi:hypothetical protein
MTRPCVFRSATTDTLAAGVFALALLTASTAPLVARTLAVREVLSRVEQLAPPRDAGVFADLGRAPTGPLLASWQTVGGCGAGSASGVGDIKWIGRNVTGGLVHVQCQGSYTRYGDGYSYTVNNQLDVGLGDKWSAGVSIPYLYKYIYNPWGTEPRIDVSNQGLGDINALVTRRFGAVNDTALTLFVGFPTGTHAEHYGVNYLRQDRQLGAGKMSGALQLEHTMDNLWGPVVLGSALNYPGGENDLQDYRAPSARVYGYAGYLLGRLVPALGVWGTAFAAHDRDRTLPSDRPMFMGGTSASLEWSSDWVAILGGVSVPFSRRGLEPWTAGIGIAVAPF